ncbi:MAG: TIGR02117 family protein [Saprospiraceae bacterium]|nr:TIGR02117 family protein [Saprospiraceae bacterium]
MLKRALKITGITLGSFIGFILLYLAAAYCLSRITVNDDVAPKNDVTIYILSNGVHTDIVLPLKTALIDWSRLVKFEHTEGKDSTAQFVAFGWGDKGFYLETPTWAELKASVAFKAAFALSTSAIHATFYKEMQEGETCKSIKISHSAYQKLVNYIRSSFQKTAAGTLMHIPTDATYGKHDAFYEAVGSYSMFHTCNTWANNGLKACGQKASLWTPFDTGIFYHYE